MVERPSPRGPVSEVLLKRLGPEVRSLPRFDPGLPGDPLADEDLQLALYLCYELHYRGIPGAHPDWEWEPTLLHLRRELEAHFMAGLTELVGDRDEHDDLVDPEALDLALRAIAEADAGPSLSTYVERDATHDQVLEFLVHRSAYQLKEADPHTWAIPRLHGAPKAALVEVQADEYGGGRAERLHASLFAKTLAAAGLHPGYGAYLDHIPGLTLATVNLMSMLGLHRRWRGAIVGHLAVFEMTSSIPNRRYGNGLRRLGFPEAAVDFFDEHVVADAVHENIAAVDLAGGLGRQEPELLADIIWGGRALVEVDTRWSTGVLSAWQAGVSSLRTPLRAEPAAPGAATLA